MAHAAQIETNAERWQRVVVPYLEAQFHQAESLEQQWADHARLNNLRDRASDRQAWRARAEREAIKAERGGSRFGAPFPAAPDTDEVRDWSRRRAAVVRGIVARCFGDPEQGLHEAQAYALGFGLPIPEVRDPAKPSTGKNTLTSAIARLSCSRWWKRAGRSHKLRQREARAIGAGRVHKHTAFAVSDESIRWRRECQRHTADLMDGLEAVRERDGLRLDMGTVVAGSLANPRVRIAEIGMRAKGLEDVAHRRGFVGFVAHLTTPSRFHARVEKTGKRNPKWDGSTPKQAQAYLCEVWGKVRALLAKRGVEWFGLRCAEPHHDGTPHWHILVFCHPQLAPLAQQILRDAALKDSPNEHGAAEHRCRIENIDRTRGSATAYVLKYILKGIPGGVHGPAMTPDDKGQLAIADFDAPTHAERISTWSWLWGIRQFATLGKPARMAEYRELRRMREPVQLDLIEPLRRAADEGRFADFVRLSEVQPCRIVREDAEAMGVSPLTAYGERAALPLVGVTALAREFVTASDGVTWQTPWVPTEHVLLTRLDRWTIERKAGQGAGMESAAPWTRVNNCNRPPDPDREPDREPDPPPGFTPDEWSEWCQA